MILYDCFEPKRPSSTGDCWSFCPASIGSYQLFPSIAGVPSQTFMNASKSSLGKTPTGKKWPAMGLYKIARRTVGCHGISSLIHLLSLSDLSPRRAARPSTKTCRVFLYSSCGSVREAADMSMQATKKRAGRCSPKPVGDLSGSGPEADLFRISAEARLEDLESTDLQ